MPPINDGWTAVWEKLTDSDIEESLRDYLWLAANTPNAHANRKRWAALKAQRTKGAKKDKA
jgi:hypothetical protein